MRRGGSSLVLLALGIAVGASAATRGGDERSASDSPVVCPVQAGSPVGTEPTVDSVEIDGFVLTLWSCPGAFVTGVDAAASGLVFARLGHQGKNVWQSSFECRAASDELDIAGEHTRYLGYEKRSRVFVFDQVADFGLCDDCAPKCESEALFGITESGEGLPLLSDEDPDLPGHISEVHLTQHTLRNEGKLLVTVSTLARCYDTAGLVYRYELREGKLERLGPPVLQRGLESWPCPGTEQPVYDPETGRPDGTHVLLRQDSGIRAIDFSETPGGVLFLYELADGRRFWSRKIMQECYG